MITGAIAEQALRFGLIELGPTWFMQIANTIILFLILKKLLFKPVTEFMENRETEIANQLDGADNLMKEAETLMADYKKKIANAEEEGRQIIRTATQKSEQRASEIIKDAEAQIKELKDKAEKDIERERVKAVNSLKDEIATIAVMAASKVIEKDIDEETHKQLINQFIREVGESRWQN